MGRKRTKEEQNENVFSLFLFALPIALPGLPGFLQVNFRPGLGFSRETMATEKPFGCFEKVEAQQSYFV